MAPATSRRNHVAKKAEFAVGRVTRNASPRRTVNCDRSRQHDSGVRWMVYGSRFIHLAVMPGRSCPQGPLLSRARAYSAPALLRQMTKAFCSTSPRLGARALSSSLFFYPANFSAISRAHAVVRRPRCELSFSEGDRCVSCLGRKKTSKTRGRSVRPPPSRRVSALRSQLDVPSGSPSMRHATAGLVAGLQGATNRSAAMRETANGVEFSALVMKLVCSILVNISSVT